MGSQKWVDRRFGDRVKAERYRRGWSQADMAKLLSANGVHPMHPTTIAKIEAGDRSVRINEAVAIAEAFEINLDTLLGIPSGRSPGLDYALGALLDAVYTAQADLGRNAGSLKGRLDDIPSDFGGRETLKKDVFEAISHMIETHEVLSKVEHQLIEDMEWRSAKQVARELKQKDQE
jgi:transcriptional regulator with XRE-family HTH domain